MSNFPHICDEPASMQLLDEDGDGQKLHSKSKVEGAI